MEGAESDGGEENGRKLEEKTKEKQDKREGRTVHERKRKTERETI